MSAAPVDVLSVMDAIATDYDCPCGHASCVKQAERARLLEAHNDVSALVKAAEQAVASEGGLRYAHDEDEIGERACCLVTSYKPHAPDCWVPRLAAALNKVKGG